MDKTADITRAAVIWGELLQMDDELTSLQERRCTARSYNSLHNIFDRMEMLSLKAEMARRKLKELPIKDITFAKIEYMAMRLGRRKRALDCKYNQFKQGLKQFHEGLAQIDNPSTVRVRRLLNLHIEIERIKQQRYRTAKDLHALTRLKAYLSNKR